MAGRHRCSWSWSCLSMPGRRKPFQGGAVNLQARAVYWAFTRCDRQCKGMVTFTVMVMISKWRLSYFYYSKLVVLLVNMCFHRTSQLSWLPVPCQCYFCGRVKQCSVSAVSVLRPGNRDCYCAEHCIVPRELVPALLCSRSLSFWNVHVHWYY